MTEHSTEKFSILDLEAYLDGELALDEVQRIKAWLDADPAAAAQLEALEAQDAVFRMAVKHSLQMEKRSSKNNRRCYTPAMRWKIVTAKLLLIGTIALSVFGISALYVHI